MWYWISGVIAYLLIGLTWARYDVINGKRFIEESIGAAGHSLAVSFGWPMRLLCILLEFLIDALFVYILDPLLKDSYTHIEGEVSDDILSRYKHCKVSNGSHGTSFRVCDESSKYLNIGYIIKNLKSKDRVVLKLSHPNVKKLDVADFTNELRTVFKLRPSAY